MGRTVKVAVYRGNHCLELAPSELDVLIDILEGKDTENSREGKRLRTRILFKCYLLREAPNHDADSAD